MILGIILDIFTYYDLDQLGYRCAVAGLKCWIT